MAFLVTDQAIDQLKRMLDAAESKRDRVIRFTKGPEGKLGFFLDIERKGDRLIQRKGETVMVVEPTLQKALADRTLEFGGEKGSWVLRRSVLRRPVKQHSSS